MPVYVALDGNSFCVIASSEGSERRSGFMLAELVLGQV